MNVICNILEINYIKQLVFATVNVIHSIQVIKYALCGRVNQVASKMWGLN